MALAGGVLYVAGDFNVIDGQTRTRIAAFDRFTGTLTAWDPQASGSKVLGPGIFAIQAHGDTIFVGGDFTRIGGQPRVCLAALDARTGLALEWNPGAANSIVNAMAVRGNTLFVGGYFTQLGGQQRRLAAAVDISTGAVTPWDPGVTGPSSPYVTGPYVSTLLVRDSTVFIGGRFDTVGGQPRSALAAVDAVTAAPRNWHPDPIYHYSFPWPYVWALAALGDTIFVGGSFDAVGGQEHAYLAAVDARTGAATSWSPRPNEQVWSLASNGFTVFVGGSFRSMGAWVHRSCLAALDLTTGAVKGWDPDPNGLVVYSVVASGGTVYAAGDFTRIGGQARSGVAAVDTLTGAATTWNPAADGSVTSMLLDGTTLYIGGGFWNVGGQTRHYVAALDTATGLATAWDPRAGDWVFALAKTGNTVYVGGAFGTMGGEPHQALAAVDGSTGAVLPWKADADGIVKTLVVEGTTVYAGGQYISNVNGQSRNCLAALDAGSGAVRPWDAHLAGSVTNPTPSVEALALCGHTLYVAGDFYSLGGQVRPCLAALDDSVGLATAWAPRANFQALSLAISDHTLYAGGAFGSIGLLPTCGLAALSIPTDPVVMPPTFALGQSFPNPAQGRATVRFSLAAASLTTFSVFDVQGRRVAAPLNHTLLQPGQHDVALQLTGLRPGVYLYHLDSGGSSATRKMLVLK